MLGLFFAFVALCAADYPALPQAFEADVNINAAGTALPGHLWFDFTAHGAHVSIPGLAELVATPVAASSQTFLYGVLGGACQTAGSVSWSQLPASFFIPPGSVPLPNRVINGVACNGWNYTAPAGSPLPYISFYLAEADHSIVRLAGKVTPPGSSAPTSFLVDFSNTKVGPVAASNFDKPGGCP